MKKTRVWSAILSLVLAVVIAGCSATASASTIYYRDRVAVLMYHAFEEPPDSPIMVTAQELREHLQTLKVNGFNFITEEQFKAWKQGTGTVPDNAILITIDDGWPQIRSVALPIFKKYQAPATAFVIYGRVDNSPIHLTSEDLLALKQDGTISIQSHTWNLHYSVTMPDGSKKAVALTKSYDELRQDAARARTFHQNLLGDTPDMLAYPFGAYNQDFINAAQAEGIQYAFTTKTGLTTKSTPNMEIPRINAGVSGQTGAKVLSLIQSQIKYYVGGGFYQTYEEAVAAAQHFTQLTGYKIYPARHPSLDGWWVQSGRISTYSQALYFAQQWAKWGLKYII